MTDSSSGPVPIAARRRTPASAAAAPSGAQVCVRSSSPRSVDADEASVGTQSEGTGEVRMERDHRAGTGRGIIGMSERARSCGGALSARAVDGGFLVEARLPLPTHEVSRSGAEAAAP